MRKGASRACAAPAPFICASHTLLTSPLAPLPHALAPRNRPDKEGLACAVCLDQTLRVFIVTKLNKL